MKKFFVIVAVGIWGQAASQSQAADRLADRIDFEKDIASNCNIYGDAESCQKHGCFWTGSKCR